jgi:uncharacterized phosphosugar-binding protein/N-acetylglucosamine kinase-like BadF-type ATPase
MRILGVDGGQSAIRVRLAGSARVVDVAGLSRGEGDLAVRMADAVAEAVRTGGLGPVDRVVLGLTTAPTDPAEGRRLCALVSAATGADEVWLADDSVTAHAGALGGGPGVSLVAGTGVACLALPSHGAARSVGGHGFLLGDEGGGFWLGREGIGAVLRAFEGRGPATSLTERALDAFGGPLATLHVRLHDADRAVHEIASFAPAVLAAADADDAVALAIVAEGARELAGVVRAAAAIVGAEKVDVALGGRLLADDTPLRRHLDALLADPPGLAVRTADGTPLDGAVLLGERGAHPYGELVLAWRAADAPAGAGPEPVPAADGASAGHRYLAAAADLVDRLSDAGWPAIDLAAELVADALAGGGTVHAFGTGHSHMLAEELYYRAGGLVRANPILVEALMLHEGGERSTELERRADAADEIFADHPMTAGDVLFIASNSGGNPVGSRLALLAKAAGVHVVAIESVAHATSSLRRDTGAARLHDIADVVIDNGGCPGDAAVSIDGFDSRVGPTSTVTGAAIMNAVVAEAVERLVARGITPEVYVSANVAGGDEANARVRAGGAA